MAFSHTEAMRIHSEVSHPPQQCVVSQSGERRSILKKTVRFSLYKLQNQAKLSYGARGLGCGGDRKGCKGASGVLVIFCFLAWELVKQVCSVY